MKIEMHEIPIRDVLNGYLDSADNGLIFICKRNPAFL